MPVAAGGTRAVTAVRLAFAALQTSTTATSVATPTAAATAATAAAALAPLLVHILVGHGSRRGARRRALLGLRLQVSIELIVLVDPPGRQR